MKKERIEKRIKDIQEAHCKFCPKCNDCCASGCRVWATLDNLKEKLKKNK